MHVINDNHVEGTIATVAYFKMEAANTKGGSISVPLTSCLTSLELAV